MINPAKLPKNNPHRIPYDSWANSQLSIVKYYGGCSLNGKKYILDYKNCRTTGEGNEIKYFPDLVEVVEKKGEME